MTFEDSAPLRAPLRQRHAHMPRHMQRAPPLHSPLAPLPRPPRASTTSTNPLVWSPPLLHDCWRLPFCWSSLDDSDCSYHCSYCLLAFCGSSSLLACSGSSSLDNRHPPPSSHRERERERENDGRRCCCMGGRPRPRRFRRRRSRRSLSPSCCPSAACLGCV